MQRPDAYAPAVRLEDIGRRSACDRCRRMKTRCERSQYRDIAQLQQCRRCRQAQTNCITTIEAQPDPHEPSGETDQRAYKRPRPSSSDSNNSLHPRENVVPFDEKRQDILQDVFSPHHVAGNASLHIQPEGSDFNYDLLLRHGTEHPWLEFGHDFGLEESAIPSMLPTPYATSSLDNPFTIEQATRSPTPSKSLEALNTLEPAAEPRAQPGDHSRHDTPTPGAHTKPRPQLIMAALMSFNHALSSDLQSHHTNTDQFLLRTSLHHITSFLAILHTIYDPDDSAPRSTSLSIDLDIALQLLSCHTNLRSLYERLCLGLHQNPSRPSPSVPLSVDDSAQILSNLRLDGLACLSAIARTEVLLKFCHLAYAEVARRLDTIRTVGLLTVTAARTFESVLGGSAGRELGHGLSERL